MTEKNSKKILIWLCLLFISINSLAFAQDENIGKQLSEAIISIVVIVIIILVLLYLGGLLKFRGGGIIGRNLPLLFYMFLIIIIFILPFVERLGIINIFPDNLDDFFYEDKEKKQVKDEYKGYVISPLPQPVCKVFMHLNISEIAACYMPAFIYFFILPFAAIYAITWAFLKQLKIFEGLGRPLEALIAFIIAFMTLPMGTFLLFVAMWFSFTGVFSIAIFVAMVIAGVFLRGYGFIYSEAYSVGLKIYGQRSQTALRKIEALLEEFDKLSLDKVKEELKDLRDAFKDLDAFTGVFPTKSDIDAIQSKDVAKQKIEEIKRRLKS